MTTILKTISGNTDIFICCAGFEDRTLGVLQKLSNFNFKKGFIIQYKKTVEVPTSSNNEDVLMEKLSKIGDVDILIIDPLNPLQELVPFFQKIKNCDPNSITIDVTVMSRVLLFLLLRNLTENNLLNHSKFLYTEPKDYPVAYKRLSIGNSAIEVMPTFAGNMNSGKEKVLLIQLGYEGDRALTVWEKLEPEKCILTVPYPPYRDDWLPRMRNQSKEIIEAVGDDNLHRSDSRSPKQVFLELKKIFNDVDSLHEKNWYISTMGTKPQAIGAFCFYWKSHGLPTMIYSTPKYHTEYSVGIGPTYYLELPELEPDEVYL